MAKRQPKTKIKPAAETPVTEPVEVPGTPIPEQLKKLRLYPRLAKDLARHVANAACGAAIARMKEIEQTLAQEVWTEAVGGVEKAEDIWLLPEGWLTMNDNIYVRRGQCNLRLKFGGTRPMPAKLIHYTYEVKDHELQKRVFAFEAEKDRALTAAQDLQQTLEIAFKGLRNVHAALTTPGVPQHTPPDLVKHLMDQVRPENVPSIADLTVASAFARIDGIPAQPAA